ncbi:hypothetical protein [Antrihabitans cavernicola]|uniref:Uncharacterized protein n=1 Tax=Antrihabitans cavernicola TaxID=2495913 RepID=A0A5A7S4D8_9NOCA|nr:hypothetical protein [Spelaeibacter cavernicola]KAA0019443.1 hypothetical protein FOY51_22630 [Spelaeibacter cavernicola]
MTATPGRLMFEHVGLAFTSPDRVRALLFESPARNFGSSVPIAGLAYEVDRANGWVQASGQWWWSGRYTVSADAVGTRIVQQTFNLATGPVAVIVPLTVGRGSRSRSRQGLQQVLDRIATELNCRTEILP